VYKLEAEAERNVKRTDTVPLVVHTCTGKTMSATYQEINILANNVRGIDLQRVLQSINARKDTCDKKKWHTERGVISVSGIKFMNWNTGTGGGGAIDLVIHLKKLDFKNAVRWLTAMFPEHALKTAKIPVSVPKHQFHVPTRWNTHLPRVKQYLIEKRCLRPELISTLVRSGKLYADKRGNAVFLLLGKE